MRASRTKKVHWNLTTAQPSNCPTDGKIVALTSSSIGGWKEFGRSLAFGNLGDGREMGSPLKWPTCAYIILIKTCRSWLGDLNYSISWAIGLGFPTCLACLTLGKVHPPTQESLHASLRPAAWKAHPWKTGNLNPARDLAASLEIILAVTNRIYCTVQNSTFFASPEVLYRYHLDIPHPNNVRRVPRFRYGLAEIIGRLPNDMENMGMRYWPLKCLIMKSIG